MTESPRAFREKNPYTPPPPEYKPPSMLAQHWRLAVLFSAVCIAFAVYCFKAPRAPRAVSASGTTQPMQPEQPAQPKPATPSSQPTQTQPPQPIYIEAIPQEGAAPKP